MTRPKDSDLDRLLAAGRLSGPGRDRVLSNVLRAVAPPAPRPWWRRRLFWWAPASALAVCLPLLFGLPVPPTPDASPKPGLRAKGGGVVAPTRLELGCSGGLLERCPRGSTLLFRVTGELAEPAFLSAFAEPAGGGERIWYFSAEEEAPSVRIAGAAGDDPAALSRGVRVGGEHGGGRYRVRLVLARRSLTRAETLEARPGDDAIVALDDVVLEIVEEGR